MQYETRVCIHCARRSFAAHTHEQASKFVSVWPPDSVCVCVCGHTAEHIYACCCLCWRCVRAAFHILLLHSVVERERARVCVCVCSIALFICVLISNTPFSHSPGGVDQLICREQCVYTPLPRASPSLTHSGLTSFFLRAKLINDLRDKLHL